MYVYYKSKLSPTFPLRHRSDGSLDSRSPPSVPSLVTNDWLQQIIPRLSRMPITQELSAANAQQGLIVVRLHHSVQHQQQRVTDRCLFCNSSLSFLLLFGLSRCVPLVALIVCFVPMARLVPFGWTQQRQLSPPSRCTPWLFHPASLTSPRRSPHIATGGQRRSVNPTHRCIIGNPPQNFLFT
jgi:hypothetical protein